MKIEIIYGPCFQDPTGEWRANGLETKRFVIDFGTGIEIEEIENAACAVATSHIGRDKYVIARPQYNNPYCHDGLYYYEWRSFGGAPLTQVDFQVR